jgi:hypothetical protein
MKTKIKLLLNGIFKRLYILTRESPPTDVDNKVVLSFRIDIEVYRQINKLIDKSGVNDMGGLMQHSFGLFDRVINHELDGGSVRFVSKDGSKSEDLDILEILSDCNYNLK